MQMLLYEQCLHRYTDNTHILHCLSAFFTGFIKRKSQQLHSALFQHLPWFIKPQLADSHRLGFPAL